MNELRTFRLSHGKHNSPEEGTCVMEAAAMISGSAFSDSAPCICPVIGALCRAWNDGLPTDEDRDRLLQQFVYRLPGTKATPEIELKRSWMAFDWLVRECVAEFMSLSPSLSKHVEILRGLPPILQNNFDQTVCVLNAAGAAAGDAAWDAARAATWDAARAAARAALSPSVAKLQKSAVRLLDRMIRMTEPKELTTIAAEQSKQAVEK